MPLVESAQVTRNRGRIDGEAHSIRYRHRNRRGIPDFARKRANRASRASSSRSLSSAGSLGDGVGQCAAAGPALIFTR